MESLMIVLLMTAATFGAALMEGADDLDSEDTEEDTGGDTGEDTGEDAGGDTGEDTGGDTGGDSGGDTTSGPLDVAGTTGTDEALDGTSGEDTLTANDGDADSLSGGAGADLLNIATGTRAAGGAGGDTFYLGFAGSADTVITDFNTSADTLILEDLHAGDLALYLTDDLTGLRLVETATYQTVLTLEDTTLNEGDSLSLTLRDSSGGTPVDTTLTLAAPLVSGPEYIDASLGTSGPDSLSGSGNADFLLGYAGDDSLSGSAGGDVLIGGEGADSLLGGTGADTLISGGSFDVLTDDSLGLAANVGSGADVLEGGSGGDTLWLGAGSTGTGGTGTDVFNTFIGVHDSGYTAPEITDFTAGDDIVTAYVAASDSFGIAEAAAGLSVSYDAGADSTSFAMGGETFAILQGNQTGLAVVLRDSTGDAVSWYDSTGTAITAEAGAAGDVVIDLQTATALSGAS